MFLLGRYFGVVASWHWRDIVETIKKHYPEYSGQQQIQNGHEEPKKGRKSSDFQVHLRDLDEIVGQAIRHLKSIGDI